MNILTPKQPHRMRLLNSISANRCIVLFMAHLQRRFDTESAAFAKIEGGRAKIE
jgi:hypothetical protein